MSTINQPEVSSETVSTTAPELPKKKLNMLYEAVDGPEQWYRVKNYSKQDVCSKNGIIIKPGHARAVTAQELQDFDPDLLNILVGSEELTIRELDIDRSEDYLIVNLTTERITLKHNIFPDREFFVPGSGSRKVKGETLLHLDYLLWENQGLIQVESVAPGELGGSGSPAGKLTDLVIVFLGVIFLGSVAYAFLRPNDLVWVIVGILGLLTGVLSVIRYRSLRDGERRELFESLENWFSLLPGLILILGTGIGLPILIMSLVFSPETFTSLSPSIFLRIGFISVASILPAFLFYLFGRQQVKKQRDNFYREAMLLDPNVWSYSEAENKYGPLLNTVYDTGNSPFSIVLLLITTALLVTGWIIALFPIPPAETPANLLDFFSPLYTTEFTLGFLGAYFFTINLVYRRYVRADLTPKTYAYLNMRLITTFILVWAVSTLPLSKTVLPSLAFIIGIFPESALTLIQDYVNKLTALRGGKNANQLSLTKLEGMNLYDQARLMEEGIENIENLAHHNLMELIVRTRIPTARLVDMFDQAILYIHLGVEDEEGSKKDKDSMRQLLRSFGVRTATDLLGSRKKIAELNNKGDENLGRLQRNLTIIVATLQDDEWLNYIRCWRENSSTKIKMPVNDPYKFYNRATGIEEAQEKEEKRKKAEDAQLKEKLNAEQANKELEMQEPKPEKAEQTPDLPQENMTVVVQAAAAGATQ